MKIGVIMGSGHGLDGTTGQLVQGILDRVAQRTALTTDLVCTDDLALGPSCPTCLSCMTAGEQSCVNFDNASAARTVMDDADLVIFATPVHSFHVSASMKRFVDHFAYLIHRPAYFGTPAVLVSSAAGAGHDAALGYVEEAIRRWGFHTVGRLGANGPGLDRPAYRQKVDDAQAELATTIIEAVQNPTEPKPSTKDLIGFRVARLLVESGKDAGPVDDEYWTKRGWYDADWFTDVTPAFLPNRIAAMVEKRIRSAIEKGTAKPFR